MWSKLASFVGATEKEIIDRHVSLNQKTTLKLDQFITETKSKLDSLIVELDDEENESDDDDADDLQTKSATLPSSSPLVQQAMIDTGIKFVENVNKTVGTSHSNGVYICLIIGLASGSDDYGFSAFMVSVPDSPKHRTEGTGLFNVAIYNVYCADINTSHPPCFPLLISAAVSRSRLCYQREQ